MCAPALLTRYMFLYSLSFRLQQSNKHLCKYQQHKKALNESKVLCLFKNAVIDESQESHNAWVFNQKAAMQPKFLRKIWQTCLTLSSKFASKIESDMLQTLTVNTASIR
jgi:hypothetical protein